MGWIATLGGGVISPMGARATKVDGGYRVRGRSSFASGCEHAQWLYGNETHLDAPIQRIPTPALLACEIACVAVGAALGALDDVTEIARSKVPLLARGPLAASALLQHQLGTADVKLRAARSLLYAEVEEATTTARSGAPFTPERRARLRSAATWAITTAAAVVDAAFTAAGGSAVHARHPLQRGCATSTP